MRSSFLSKYKPKITRISAFHTNKDCSTFFGEFLVSVGSFFLAMILVCLEGQKSILGETMTLEIHSEFNLPLTD